MVSESKERLALSNDADSAPNWDVLLVNPPYRRRHGGGIVPPIGLCYLAGKLRSLGARPAIVDLAGLYPNQDGDHRPAMKHLAAAVERRVREGSPVFVGVGPLVTASLRSVREIVGVCHEMLDVPVVVGGPLCSVPGFSKVAAEFLGADAFVAGDGESPIAGIWKSLRGGGRLQNLPGVGIPSAPEPLPYREPHLDDLELPDRRLLAQGLYRPSLRRGLSQGVTTAAFLSRGCPYSCTFCAAPLSSGKAIRRLSAQRIGQELRNCAELGIDHVVFYDDCLFTKGSQLESRVLEFSAAVKSSSWRGTFQIELRCDAVVCLSDRAILALRDAGCRQVNMGIEKMHPLLLKRLRKVLTPEVAAQACARLQNTSIRAAGTFILGGPDEKPADLESTISFAVSLPLDFAHFNPLAIYPGTALFTEIFGPAENADWVRMCLDPAIAPLGDILWQSNTIPLSMILNAVAEGYRRFYSSERLTRLIAKLPEAEIPQARESYSELSDKRSHSWNTKNDTSIAFPAYLGSTVC